MLSFSPNGLSSMIGVIRSSTIDPFHLIYSNMRGERPPHVRRLLCVFGQIGTSTEVAILASIRWGTPGRPMLNSRVEYGEGW